MVVIVLGAVTSTGRRMSPRSFGPEEKVDADANLNVSEYAAKPWIETVTRLRVPARIGASSHGQENAKVLPTKLQHGVDRGHAAP